MPNDENIENFKLKKDATINRALGIFISVFGIIILIATTFTETFVGEMTNLVAGSILVIIGVTMVVVAFKNLKKIDSSL